MALIHDNSEFAVAEAPDLEVVEAVAAELPRRPFRLPVQTGDVATGITNIALEKGAKQTGHPCGGEHLDDRAPEVFAQVGLFRVVGIVAPLENVEQHLAPPLVVLGVAVVFNGGTGTLNECLGFSDRGGQRGGMALKGWT